MAAIWPGFKISVALRVLNIPGMPSSRLTMAAWEFLPPKSVTKALACFFLKVPIHPVFAVSETRMVESLNRLISL